jgi:hypothetical protein
MMRRLAALAVILLMSGCICCGGKDISDFTGGGDTSGDEVQSGGEDASEETADTAEDAVQSDDTSSEETAETTEETTETTQPPEDGEATETTQPEVTTTLGATATTQPPQSNMAIYNCVSKIPGLNPNEVFYGYSTRCGDAFKATASMVSIQKGVDIRPVNIAASTDEPAIKLLECFYGPYSSSNPNFGYCPQLLCPKTGATKILTGMGQSSVKSQMEGFALKCK